MTAEHCYASVCFVALSKTGPKFFGFAEFLAGLALMVLAWTNGDFRYKFRINTSALSLQRITFGMVASVGVLTMLTDLWRAEGWFVPQGHLLTPGMWQALLAVLFLSTFLMWAWIAFISPPTFKKANAPRFARAIYRSVLRGSQTELAIVADELTYSAEALVRYATDWKKLEDEAAQNLGPKPKPTPPEVTRFADDILLLIADKRLCRAIVESSSITALAFFQEMCRTKKYGIRIQIFAQNVIAAAMADKSSFIYQEKDGYESGLVGYHKPRTQAIFASYELVETIDTLLDPDIGFESKWDSAQWEAYCRLVLTTFRDYVMHHSNRHSFVLFRAFGNVEKATHNLFKLNGVTATSEYDPNLYQQTLVVSKFIVEAIKILDEKGIPRHIHRRLRGPNAGIGETFFDYLAVLIFETIRNASAVQTPQWQCWSIQHGVWSDFFNFNRLNTPAGNIVKFKVRRLLFNEVNELSHLPNIRSARVLGFCLNVMGLRLSNYDHSADSLALHKATLTWTAKNYATLFVHAPEIAKACLVETVTYDPRMYRLIKTYPSEWYRRTPQTITLQVDPPKHGDIPDDRIYSTSTIKYSPTTPRKNGYMHPR